MFYIGFDKQIDSYEIKDVWAMLCNEELDNVLVQAVVTDPPGKEHLCRI
jgi:hypothetical protein